MKISTVELKEAVLLILRHMEQNGQKEFDIEEDFYWSVPEHVRYHPYDEPKEFTIGQLTDDWSEVKQIMIGERDVIGYGLVWLSSVLRRVGEKSNG